MQWRPSADPHPHAKISLDDATGRMHGNKTTPPVLERQISITHQEKRNDKLTGQAPAYASGRDGGPTLTLTRTQKSPW